MGVVPRGRGAGRRRGGGLPRALAPGPGGGRRVRRDRPCARGLGLADALRPVAGRAGRLRAVGTRRAARRHGRRAARSRRRRQAVAGTRAASGARGRGSPRLPAARDDRGGARRRRAVRVRARTLAVRALACALAAGGRPLQIESLAASALVSLDRLGVGGPYSVVTSSGSQNLSGGWVERRRCALDARAGRRARHRTGSRHAGRAARRVTIARRSPSSRAGRCAPSRAASRSATSSHRSSCCGSCRSPCSSPDVAVWRSRRSPRSPCVLTLEEFPGRYWEYATGFDGGVAALVLVRDLVLVAIAVAAALPAPPVRAVAGRSRSPSHAPS